VKKFVAILFCFGVVCALGSGLTGCSKDTKTPAKTADAAKTDTAKTDAAKTDTAKTDAAKTDTAKTDAKK